MTNATILQDFMQKVWNEQDFSAIPTFLAPAYTIHLDHTDPWEGKTLTHEEFRVRLGHSFGPFPDMHFAIKSTIADGDSVAITWVMTGTNLGNIGDIPATNRSIEAEGMTIYYFKEAKICGHSQVFDHSTIIRQLGFGG